jgi:hypothetical protein
MAYINTAQSDVTIPSLHCLDCGAPTRLLAMIHSARSRKLDQITYRCEVCNIKVDYRTLNPAT